MDKFVRKVPYCTSPIDARTGLSNNENPARSLAVTHLSKRNGGRHPPSELDSRIWRNLPPEILLQVVEWVRISEHLHESALHALAGVCKRWREQCAPEVYAKKYIRIAGFNSLKSLIRCLQDSDGLFCRSVTAVTVLNLDDDRVLTFLPRLSTALPHTTMLTLERRTRHAQKRRLHPDWPKMVAGCLSAFHNISELWLHDYNFPNFSDLVRILDALRVLTKVGLARVGWTNTSLSTHRQGAGSLTTIETKGFITFWPFLWLLNRPRPQVGDAYGNFLGLPANEAAVMKEISLLGMRGTNKQYLRLRKSSVYPDIWIIQICEEVIQINNPDTSHIRCVPKCCVEFHISQEPLWQLQPTGATAADSVQEVPPARICWIVFSSALDFTVAASDAEQLNDWLLGLAWLEQVMVESWNVPDAVHWKDRLIRVSDKVYVRSIKDADTAKEKSIPTGRLPISLPWD